MVVSEAVAAHVPKFVVEMFIPGLTVTTRIMYGFVPTDPVDVIPRIERPIFFIHEQDDNTVSWQDTTRLFGASTNPGNEIWEVNSVEHSQGYQKYPVEYVERLDSFFSRSLVRQEP